MMRPGYFHRFYRFRSAFTGLRENCSGLAMVEFAAVLPFGLILCLTGAELTNYATTRMRISQLALHVADHVSRIGNG